jgi:hypothetical protein
MINEDIRRETKKQYAHIKRAEEKLKVIRTICKHEKTFTGGYSHRKGHVALAEICEYCGEFIRYITDDK